MAKKPFYTPVRRNHLIAPFGVGSVTRFKNGLSVAVCGLGEWLSDVRDPAYREKVLSENRVVDGPLQVGLGVRRLIAPPAVKDEEGVRDWFVPVVRFPQVEHCTDPGCRRMVQRPAGAMSQTPCEACEEPSAGRRKSTRKTLQVPLVMTCAEGHLDDVPWFDLVHGFGEAGRSSDDGRSEPCSLGTLTYKVSLDVGAPGITCVTCGKSLDLRSIRGKEIACRGRSAWLPDAATQACSAPAVLIEHTSTRLYYPSVRSSLHIPHGAEYDHRIMKLLEVPHVRLQYEEDWILPVQPDGVVKALARLARSEGIEVTDEEMLMHVQEALDPTPVVEQEDREREAEALGLEQSRTSSKVGLADLVVETRDLVEFGAVGGRPLSHWLERLSGVVRLTETRVLCGFSRVQPKRPAVEAGKGLLWGARRGDWLPAHRVYGEGIYLELAPTLVSAWLKEQASASSAALNLPPLAPDGAAFTPQHALAHTLAHVLMREAAEVCGYALPSLRERLFVNADPEHSRTGLLVYTAEGDAYGTLGGLLELSRPGNFEGLLERALQHASWCGADPICADPPREMSSSTPGTCHQCTLLPETSCEVHNKGLSRSLLVKTAEGAVPFFDR